MFKTAIINYLEENKISTFLPRAVFFDMDGVLFDSMPNHAAAWTRAMSDIGIEFSLNDAYMQEGRTGASTIDGAMQKNFGRDATEEEKQDIYRLKTKYFDEFPPAKPMPYARELLDKIKAQGLDIYLVTGSGTVSLLDNLQAHFPDIFVQERMVTAFDVTEGKPSPEPYLKALAKSGLERRQVCVVENAPLGTRSAHDAGLFVIGLNTGILQKDDLYREGANVVLDSMQQLFETWEKFTDLCR
ncbi:MAG: HAD-IA family hydrolase [Paludibacter sp.]|jgi:HAD superfamily hydrolase (TIGR01509 family)|nr:HAD-IA family hydrolase [Paludibacter sp.]